MRKDITGAPLDVYAFFSSLRCPSSVIFLVRSLKQELRVMIIVCKIIA